MNADIHGGESGHKTVAVRFSHVYFSHREAEVLRDVSFHIHKGEFTALIGPNGAGKTTLLRLVMGLARPDSGKVEVFGGAADLSLAGIGYVPQYMNFDQSFPISVEEVVRMGRLRGASRKCLDRSCSDIDSAMERADVADLRHRPYFALSGGQRRRVLVARALASEPRLLILDEPTANMDKESERKLYTILGALKRSTTIMVATHDTDFVSSLVDVVLCVGEREGREHDVVRHASVPAEHLHAGLFGGEAMQVLHDTDLPDTACCGLDETEGGGE